jgi:hypothetical protein
MSAMLLLATHGQGRRWYRYNGRSVELRTAPGMIELYGRQFQRESARWDGLPVSGWFFGSEPEARH